ncbi:MAG: NAD(P)/FAD-dependent oxidoreductase [Sphingomonadaceae bacterium]|uniref:NAD(P)/FAD-dependent oxidoreductase n=1 Tax=Thermaurantiacus sp. TaxID=2820283 RepID=UPI00298EEC00|nr:NAD(P)/FAD-dependent oxidoreductase [Thermaurantiacus sp.]MCS6986279.1 NAD(P)/FAD-dependent oxidoreductase [Sphingomonadaceae bacterium]MDW8415728.1 NAD(P)/FAD-dependent oxidoreductase [Thermaurantiacus sp.]
MTAPALLETRPRRKAPRRTAPPDQGLRKTQIVIVGGGAGGLELARRLGARFGRRRHDIILIDRSPTHVWKPLLHEVACGSLDANLDEVGYRSHGHRWGYRYFHGTLSGIDRTAREVILAPLLDTDGTELVGEHRIRYDWLVLAVGSITNDFGTPGVREHCLFLDDRAQADRFRERLLNHCLRVSRRMLAGGSGEETVKVVIVGGGATGVELAAELYNAAAGLRHYGLEVFDESRLRVTLIEAGPRILPALPEKLAAAAREELRELGVTVVEGRKVTAAERGGVRLDDGRRIEGDLIVWATGVRGAPLLCGIGGLETTPSCQLVVTETLQTTRDPRIFALGDCAYLKPDGADRPVPPRAQAAHQMAETVYRNLLAAMAGRPLRRFVYRDRGSLVSLSRFSTVGSLMGNLVGGRMAIEGRLARLMYLSLYRMHLLAIHGWLKGLALILVGHVNAVVRPRLKLH